MCEHKVKDKQGIGLKHIYHFARSSGTTRKCRQEMTMKTLCSSCTIPKVRGEEKCTVQSGKESHKNLKLQTYLSPFSRIQNIRPFDCITVEEIHH